MTGHEVSNATRKKLSAARKGKPWPGRVRLLKFHVHAEEYEAIRKLSNSSPFPGDVEKQAARMINALVRGVNPRYISSGDISSELLNIVKRVKCAVEAEHTFLVCPCGKAMVAAMSREIARIESVVALKGKEGK